MMNRRLQIAYAARETKRIISSFNNATAQDQRAGAKEAIKLMVAGSTGAHAVSQGCHLALERIKSRKPRATVIRLADRVITTYSRAAS